METTSAVAKPRAVRLAIALLWSSLGIGIVQALVLSNDLSRQVPNAMVYVWAAGAIGLGLEALFFYFISIGNYWARIIYLVWYAVGLVYMIFTVRSPAVDNLLTWSQLVLQAIALYLVFTKPGSAYFRRADGDDAVTRAVLPVGRSGWAIAAGYLALFSVLLVPSPFALACGVLAIRDIRRNPAKHGMGRAVFGIIMGALGLVGLLAFLWSPFGR